MQLKDFNSRKTLATLITRIVVWVIGVFTIGMLLQSWNLSRDLVREEVQRTSRQTSSLVRNYFDYRLASLKVLQDSNAKSDTVESFFENYDSRSLDYFFLREDNLEPVHSPDFRFITHLSDIIWDDGNALFYGLEDHSLQDILAQVGAHNSWNAVRVDSQLGELFILVRRTPIINSESGEVLGFVFVGIVLNDNADLLSSIMSGSNSDDVLLKFDDRFVASTISSEDSYTHLSILEMIQRGTKDFGKLLITETNLSVGLNKHELKIYSIQRNHNILVLRNTYLMWLSLSLAVIVSVSFVTRKWLNKKVSIELAKLMSYTKVSANEGEFIKFTGSPIYEFNHIGLTLNDTFEQLSEQTKLFQDLFNFSLSPIIVWSDNSTIMRINPAGKKALGLASDSNSQEGDSYLAFVQLMKIHVQNANLGATLTGINVPIGEKVFRWNLSAIQPNGVKTLVLAQGQDITVLIEAERQSKKARKEAESAAKARTDFLAKMSHEIRTPLNGILGISQLLKQESKNGSYQEKIDVLCQSGEHLLAVLNDVLDFAKIENGSFNVEKHNFKFSEITTALNGIYSPLCLGKGVDFVINNQLDDNAVVNTDQVRLNQILFNLVSNAIKFTHEGMVKVSFLLVPAFQEQSNMLSIIVEDSGIGISEDQISLIFDPFVQSEATPIREYGGSGLGLAIVKHLVHLLDGEILLESGLGKGTRFTVELPVTLITEQKSEQQVIEPTIEFDLFDKSLAVLLVEDNHTNAFIAKAFCEKYGMHVYWARDGHEAFELLNSMPFDLILMDNQLPSTSGIEITKEVKLSHEINTPIYACTADNLDSTREAFMAAGADYVIVKPIKENSLNQALRHFKEHHYSTGSA
ncbi:quorum-sensing autoinducer 2 sensor kinase/phosphatase LuxQ [Vibrio methylphosphonaticus]|uniref:quorum-sensing autoinducer 2 sensor kinase/phosphatase LuxQ n=1 Tax=Vibrio methylphosphonaticus TaxID=2946866 RepID=UPI00202A3C9D|nr:quorum-sensing autoinducer 2 sensor kinase/phosphatase LuxQ [Vibrio methylphosphonaticus]MCL9776667.1 ATP-binding protein [Vibrio methylphosphonaticus]